MLRIESKINFPLSFPLCRRATWNNTHIYLPIFIHKMAGVCMYVCDLLLLLIDFEEYLPVVLGVERV